MSSKNQSETQESLSYFLLPLDIDQSLAIMKLDVPSEREDEISFISNIINELTDFTIYIVPYNSEQNEFGHYYSQNGVKSMHLQTFYEFVVNPRNKARLNDMSKSANLLNKIIKDVMGQHFNENSYSDYLYNTIIKKLKQTGLASSYI